MESDAKSSKNASDSSHSPARISAKRTIEGKRRLILARAKAIHWASKASFNLQTLTVRYGTRLELGCWAIGLFATIGFVAWLQPTFNTYATKDNIASYRSLYLSIGQAMIGATAIAGTFVLFAMQVNVESLPYGLFRRFSSDRKLLSAFFISIVIAIALTSLSLSDSDEWTGPVMAAAIWAVSLNLRLLLFAYRRSLDLISPTNQLGLLKRDAERQVRYWNRRIRWLTPVIEQHMPDREYAGGEVQVDRSRYALLEANAGWAAEIRKSVTHSVSFARRAAERGDIETTGMALKTIIALNSDYITVKGRTFFSDNPLMPTGMSTDGFINDTLEHLGRLASEATSRSDERTVEQVFKTYNLLMQLYVKIEYPGIGTSKTHALLASAYLQKSVENLASTQMTDSLMEGVRVMGQAATYLLIESGAENTVSLMDGIAQCALVGVVRPNERPVTLTAMAQLSSLTLSLFKSDDANLGFAFGEMRKNVKLVTKLMLNTPDSGFSSQHSTYLGPYFSSIQHDSLRGTMRDLVNAVCAADAQSDDANRITRNIETWADGLYADIRELLIMAAEKRSLFTLDLIQWTEGLIELLLALAKAPACDIHHREELQNHANWLVSNISFLPTDEQTVRFVEGFRPAEHIFGIALAARRFEASEIIDTCRRLLMKWALEAGAHQTGWGTLERGLLALIALSAIDHELISPKTLKGQLTAKLAQPNMPGQELRDQTARHLRDKASRLRARDFEIDQINRALTHGDVAATRTLIEEVAAILSPGTVGEVRRRRSVS